MNKIESIEALSEELSAGTINILPKRCSYIRNWNSKCKLCMNACQHEAISRSVGRFSIDPERCTGCGACTAACPTSALMTTSPNQVDIVRQARAAAEACGNVACFICERDAQAVGADPTRTTVLPCLNYLDEYLICGLFACGVRRVGLLRRGCDDCEVDCAEPYFDVIVKSTKALARAWGVDGKVKVFDHVPDELCGSHARAAMGDRRAAFTQAGGSMMGYMMQAIDDVVAPNKASAKKSKKNEQIVVRTDDVYPADTYRSVRMLALLDHAGQRPYGATIESRMWADLACDESKCQRCGCCATMCATGALAFTTNHEDLPESKRQRQKDLTGTLTFTPSLCVACGLCRDSCFRHALVYSNRVLADDLDQDVVKYLFKDEPPKKKSMFSMR